MSIENIYVIGFIPAWMLMWGWLTAYFTRKWGADDEKFRGELGECLAVSFVCSLLWPMFLPIVFSVLGFAQYGWTLVNKERP